MSDFVFTFPQKTTAAGEYHFIDAPSPLANVTALRDSGRNDASSHEQLPLYRYYGKTRKVHRGYRRSREFSKHSLSSKRFALLDRRAVGWDGVSLSGKETNLEPRLYDAEDGITRDHADKLAVVHHRHLVDVFVLHALEDGEKRLLSRD